MYRTDYSIRRRFTHMTLMHVGQSAERRAQNRPDRVKVRVSPADSEGEESPGCRKLQEGIVVTTVLICDDRRSVREGLTRVMSAVPGVHRIDCVAHGGVGSGAVRGR